jgi:hypothetical protein
LDFRGVTYHIIGGGIAGLACAWFLKQKHKNIRSVVYEAAPCLGGRAYSFEDEGMNCRLDNAVHLVVGAHKFMSRFVQKDEWHTTKFFVNLDNDDLSESLSDNRDLIFKILCNTKYQDIDAKVKNQILRHTFPFGKKQRKLWFSKQDLSQRIINLLAGSVDEINLDCKLKRIGSQFGVATLLDFGTKQVEIGARDKVILALDNIACAKILKQEALVHNSCVSITYRTSQTIFLPKGASFIGVRGGKVDWIFADKGMLSAVVSDYRTRGEKLSDLAVAIWLELDKIRGVNSAFVPPYKAVCCKNATLRHDSENNAKRPDNAKTVYPNVFVAGDWTMKNHPCCMETAVKSAQRAIKTALKAA